MLTAQAAVYCDWGYGNSAGAHLALLLGGTTGVDEFEGNGGNSGVDTTVQAIIAVYPPVEFYLGERASGATSAEALMGKQADTEASRRAGPINWVTRDYPPTFMLHGTADKIVPVSASLNMYQALVKVGAIAEMHLYAEQPHGWARRPAWVKPTMNEAALFLKSIPDRSCPIRSDRRIARVSALGPIRRIY